MEKRNKGWRAQQRKLHYRNRLKLYANYSGSVCWDEDGNKIENPTWRDLYRLNWDPALRTCRTPCSCWVCRSEKYNRDYFKRDTRNELDNSLDF